MLISWKDAKKLHWQEAQVCTSQMSNYLNRKLHHPIFFLLTLDFQMAILKTHQPHQDANCAKIKSIAKGAALTC